MESLLKVLPRHSSRQDRRNSDRVQRSFPVKCRIPKGTFQPTQALDISPSGLRMEANRNFTVGSEVTIHLKPAPNRLMSLQAEVMWTSPKSGSSYEVGLHFTDGPEADFAWLRKWLLGNEGPVPSSRVGLEPPPFLGDWPSSSFPTEEARKVGDAPPLFSTSPLAFVEPAEAISSMELQFSYDPPRNGACTHRCSCGVEFSLRVQLALHCEREGHQPAPAASAEPLPVVVEPKKRSRLPWFKLLVLTGLLASAGLAAGSLKVYSTWVSSVTETAHNPYY